MAILHHTWRHDPQTTSTGSRRSDRQKAVELSWVELCRFVHLYDATQLISTSSWVELSELCRYKRGFIDVADGDSRRVEIGLHRFDVRQYWNENQWNMLLWLASITTVAACHIRHVSGEFSRLQCPRVKVAPFSDTNILQGNVATRLRNGCTFSDYLLHIS